jgi:D-alanyl-D-alanine carboxypeptidase/D-alanyl-D-alanine-endopeptidase (penicillin-binding protein 4)
MKLHGVPAVWLALSVVFLGACGSDGGSRDQAIPAQIKQIFDKPLYKSAVWGLRVVDRDSGEVIYDIEPERPFLIGSVRKLFSVGLALETLGPGHVFRTPVHRQGEVDAAGVLHGNLVLVASGDLAMGGRTNPDGSFAIADFDHNEANSLGNATLAAADPLAGYQSLAKQVAAAGVRQVTGDVLIDDRLFQPFNFRDEFDVRPIFVNDDVVDIIVNPGKSGEPASVGWRPVSAALTVQSDLATGAPGSAFAFEVEPELPACIGAAPCVATVSGSIPVDFVPPLTGQFPLIRTVRIVQPANYARTVFIEALERAGVSVAADAVAPNDVQGLPARNSYPEASRVAELVSAPYRVYAKHILKVSYNIGADTSLVLFGLTQGVDNMPAALATEQEVLATQFGIPASELHFVDGSGGGATTAKNAAVTKMLQAMSRRTTFPDYFAALPQLGVDGSLSFVTDFAADPGLAGAKGRVHAKTGTFVKGSQQGPMLEAQALAGYIDAKSGRRLVYTLTVNDVGLIGGISDVISVFQDQGTISAVLWQAQ